MKKKIKVKTNGVSTIKGKTKLSINYQKNSEDSAFDQLTPDDAEHLLCGRRLDIVLKQADEQLTLAGMEAAEVATICDVKSFSSKPGSYSASLVFEEDEVPIEQLKCFQFTDVSIVMELVGEATPEDDEDETAELYEEVDED